MEQKYRKADGVLVDETIPVIRAKKDIIQKINKALRWKNEEHQWSHQQVAVPKQNLDLDEHGFKATRMAIPLPGEDWFTPSYRRGRLHAHEAGPFYLVHKDKAPPGICHLIQDTPEAVVRRLSGKVEPFVKEKAAMAAKKKKETGPGLGTELGLVAGGWAGGKAGHHILNAGLDSDKVQTPLFEKLRAASPVPVENSIGGARYNLENKKVYIPYGHYSPMTLAHEIGHADIDRSRLGRLLQNKFTLNLPRGAMHAGLVSGTLSGLSDDENVNAAGMLLPAAMHAPQLAYEAGAHLQGLRRMHRLGATKKELLRGALGAALPAWGTYAGHAAMNTGLAVGANRAMHAQRSWEKKRRDSLKKKKKKKVAMSRELMAAFRDEMEKMTCPV